MKAKRVRHVVSIAHVFLVVVVLMMVVSLIISCEPPKQTAKPTVAIPPPPIVPITTVDATQQQVANLSTQLTTLQTQVNTLAMQLKDVAANKSAVATLQTQVTTISKDVQKLQGGDTSTKLKELTDSITALKTTVESLQRAQSASTSIGTVPVNINGLSVAFITPSAYTGGFLGTTPGSLQLAIKISNDTGSTLSNVDITGALIFSQTLYNLASDYPKLGDGISSIIYNYSYNGTNVVTFEAFNMVYGKTVINLAIPKQGSLTLRPKISLLPQAGYSIPATTVTVSIGSISYDKTP